MRHSASRRSWAAALALLAVLVMAPQAGFAAMPQTINYQGSLSDASGPVTGPVDITFKLYDAPTLGNVLWQETQPGVAVTNGVFNVTLGSVVALPPAIFDNPVYLGVTVGPLEPEMTPRQAITAVGYALRARSAEIDADTLAGLSCASDQVASWNGLSWVCSTAATDTTLSEAEVETFVTNGAIDLFAGTTLGGAAIQTGSESDTLAGLSCASGQVAKWNGLAWACAADVDTDTDTQLTEGQVETFVTNGPVDLATGTTLGGAAIQTGTDAVGLTGVNVATGVSLILASQSGTATASCAVGEVVLGGGWQGASTSIDVTNSFPITASPQGWQVDVKNTDAIADLNATAYAICATP